MSNILNVDITASDKTAGGVGQAKKTFTKAFKDAQKDLHKVATGKGSFANFSASLKGNLAGDKATKVLGQLGKAPALRGLADIAGGMGEAAEAAEALAGTLGVLGVATGGVVLGLGSAAVAAYAFSKPFISGAAGVAQLSAQLGMTAKDIQAFEGAAKRMGVTKEGADTALAGLGNAAHLALTSPAGANQRAFFGAAGINVHDYADRQGAVDTARLMVAVSRAVQAQGNAQARGRLAEALGVSSALPALNQGGDWLKSNMQSASAFGYYTDADPAKGLKSAQNDVIMGQFKDRLWRGARRAVAENGVMQGMDAIAGGLSGAVGANPSKSPVPVGVGLKPEHIQLVRQGDLGSLDTSLPAISLDQVVTGKMAPAAEKILSGADKIERLFEKGGLNRFAAVGMTASGYVESKGTFDPHIHQTKGGPGRGIFQWEEPRQRAFASWAGHGLDTATMEEEVGFALWEQRHGDLNSREAGRLLAKVGSYGDAGEIASRWFERSKDVDGQAVQRRALASAMGADLDSSGHITVDVHLHDHRSTVKTTHRDSRGRVHYAMKRG